MEYIPAPALINVIVTELLTEDDKETLKLVAGNTTITVEEELVNLYGHMGVDYDSMKEAKTRAARIIARNRFNIKKLKKLNDLAALLEEPENFASLSITTPDVLQVVNEYHGQTRTNKGNTISSLKNRSGASDVSEESDSVGEGNKEDIDLINAIAKDHMKADLYITANKDETGKVTTSIAEVEKGEAKDIKLDNEGGKSLHMHSINVDVNRGVTFTNTVDNLVGGSNKSSQTKGRTEVLKIVKSHAFNEYLNAQVLDIRSRFIDQLAILFTEELYRYR